MKTYTIYDTTSGAVLGSGHCSIDADAALQPVPTGAALLVGVEASPGRQKIVNGAAVDVSPVAVSPTPDRINVFIQILKTKGITITQADIVAATAVLRSQGQ